MRAQFIFIFLLGAGLGCLQAQTSFNSAAFYTAITGSDLKTIDAELTLLDNASAAEAFKGALLMKKSGLVTAAGEKLKLFKTGHKALELAIAKDSINAEYRFLRLIIQENAPKIVNYNSAVKKDASYLRSHYKTLSPVVRQAVLNYSRQSKNLTPGDF